MSPPLGFSLAQISRVGFPGFLIFFLAIVPMGPVPIWLSATRWLFCEGSTGWATSLAICNVAIFSVLEHNLRGYLISKGSHLPLFLVLPRIAGGVLASG